MPESSPGATFQSAPTINGGQASAQVPVQVLCALTSLRNAYSVRPWASTSACPNALAAAWAATSARGVAAPAAAVVVAAGTVAAGAVAGGGLVWRGGSAAVVPHAVAVRAMP